MKYGAFPPARPVPTVAPTLLQDMHHKHEMKAKLGTLLHHQLEYREELQAEEAAEHRQEQEAIKAAWQREEAADRAAAEQDRIRKQHVAADTLEANRQVDKLHSRMLCTLQNAGPSGTANAQMA